MKFRYDPMGNRIEKRLYHLDGSGSVIRQSATHYVRDAQGNPLAVYDLLGGDTIVLSEFNLYGSNRLGMLTTADTLVCATCTTATAPSVYLSPVGNKRYELSNHLGNVMTVISDKPVPIDTTSDGLWDYFNAFVVSATDYYPFGMGMPGRINAIQYYSLGAWSSHKEQQLVGWSYFKERLFDCRADRWGAVDRYFNRYPQFSPFAGFENSPLVITDPSGDTTVYFSQSSKHLHTSYDKLPTAIVIINKSDQFKFNTSLYHSIQKGVGSYEPTNERWRGMGIMINMNMLRSFYNRETTDGINNLTESSTNGKLAEGYYNESRTFTYLRNRTILLGNLSAIGGIDYVAAYPSLEDGLGQLFGDAHTHPNEGLPANLNGEIFDYNPSPNDLSNMGSIDIVIGRQNVYVYGKYLNGIIKLDKYSLDTPK